MNDLTQPIRSIWLSLFWKEWHEHKWKLVSLTALCTLGLCLFGLSGPHSLQQGVHAIAHFYAMLAGIFLGMSTAGRESSRNTLPFLQSLPVPMWQPAAAKLLVVLCTATLPILALTCIYCVWHTFYSISGIDLSQSNWYGPNNKFYNWGISNWLVATILSSILVASSLILWIAAAGANRSDEIRAGAIGFLIVCLIWLPLAFGLNIADKWDLPMLKYWVGILFAAAPGGVAFVGTGYGSQGSTDWWQNFLPYLESAIVGHGCVLIWYLRHYGKAGPGTSRTDGKTLALASSGYQYLAPPMRSQLTAIAWKQVRETGPLALLAIAGVLLLTTISHFTNDYQVCRHNLGETLGGITASVCFFVTLVTGIGVFLEDLKPQVDQFWRSHPVDYRLWFGVKFVVGATILAVTFGSLMLLALLLSDRSLFGGDPHPATAVGFTGLVFLLIYTLSMATYCILRQPLYAAVLTFGLLFAGIIIPQLICHHFFDTTLPSQAKLPLLLLSQVAATFVAWKAVKNNWQMGEI